LEAHQVVFSPAAKREIKKLDRSVQERVIRTLEQLSKEPRPRGLEKIQGHPDFYRIKAGADHRIIYHIFQERIIVVLVIRDRKDAYKHLDDLDGKLEAALNGLEEEARRLTGLTATG
jgi:mRNA interferase RelE/StbE